VTPEKTPQFLVDSMLGRLARWLRILGFDTWYFREIDDRELLKLHAETGRVLLTRDTRLVQCRGVDCCVLVRSDGWEDQLRQVAAALSLDVCPEGMLTRCLLCNRPLEKLEPEEAYGRIPDHVARTTSAFRGCRACDKVYWAGTHRKRMEEVVSMLRSDRKGGQEPLAG
jgi:uncharacterized protein with PIN domain